MNDWEIKKGLINPTRDVRHDRIGCDKIANSNNYIEAVL